MMSGPAFLAKREGGRTSDQGQEKNTLHLMKKFYPYSLFGQLIVFMFISVVPLMTKMYELNKFLYAAITYMALALIIITGRQIVQHFNQKAI